MAGDFKFYVGLHIPAHAHRFERCMVSANLLRRRKSDFAVNEWMLDSGAFTEITQHGKWRDPPEVYAQQVRRWRQCGRLVAAVGQDMMCEPFALERTGLSVADHQRITIERYDALLACDPGAYILPVLQGYAPREYAQHVRDYGDRLAPGAWVGVGSVCKRNARVGSVESVLLSILEVRPDLRLHGFGLKRTALASGLVRGMLHSSDSMAWSFAARRNGGNQNDWKEAARYVESVERQEWQSDLFAQG